MFISQSKNRSTVPAYDELQQTVVKFVSGKECQKKMKNNFRGNVFCASSQDDTVDECLGDTGGPVVVSGVLSPNKLNFNKLNFLFCPY